MVSIQPVNLLLATLPFQVCSADLKGTMVMQAEWETGI
jgi:hypothetical protein